MQHTLNVRAFFFNAKTDYLPYYKHFSITLDADAKAMEILKNIKAKNENFAYPEEKLVFKINELVVTGDETIGEIVERFSNELQIDPVLSYRSNHCLVINDDDFMERFELLAPYASEEDKAYYESLYALHYASESSKFNHDYIGDAILLLAHKMITEGHSAKDAILEAISDPYDGLAACEYENNLFDTQDHTESLEALITMANLSPKSSLLEKISQKLSKDALATHSIDTLNGQGVAFYAAHTQTPTQEEVFKAIEAAVCRIVRFGRERRLCGRSLIGREENLAYLKAATTLLDALDSGAEVLIVADDADLEMFSKHYKAIEKRIGREIPLALLSFDTFKQLAARSAA
ncbi:hypothetical protein MNB_SV-4-762 [hydrothermal vent metagenome]|uniref:DUF5644 domain-containing protein n=1 Tax=hydrothermal vent metagenome TaxID=652676 RepID=A0A1W1E914_9ZZZZ